MKKKTLPICCHFDEDVYREMETIAKRENTSLAQVIRNIVNMGLMYRRARV